MHNFSITTAIIFLLLSVVIYLILIMRSKWIIEQIWKHVLFIHYEIEPSDIKDLVPFEIDLYQGKAILTVVPFKMEGIRFPYLPAVPKISELWELNIRTYVKVNGKPGIYFFTLETDSKLAEIIANKLFHLPYRHSKIKAGVSGNRYVFSHVRSEISFKMETLILEKPNESKFNLWATERYSLFTKKGHDVFEGIVQHKPWTLQEAAVVTLDDQFMKMVTSKAQQLPGISYSQELKVRFKPFRKLPKKSN